jgi:hypothetical protein
MARIRSASVVVAVAVAACVAIGGWFATVDRGDPNGPRYILWKHGLLTFDPTVAFPAMVGDRQRESLVVGLSVAELERKFGRLRTRAESTAEYQKYYGDRFFLDKEILWLGDSAWLVVLKGGRAQELHLMKG